MSEHNTDVKSLAHTKWNCKYHVVFVLFTCDNVSLGFT